MVKTYSIHSEKKWCIVNFVFIFALSLLSLVQVSAQALACNDNVQVSLNQNCEADITPGMILEGEDETLIDNYSVTIGGVTGTIVTSPGVYSVTITDSSNGNSCWGNITVEDKLAPAITGCDCPPGNDDPECQFLCTDLDNVLNNLIPVPQPQVDENCGSYVSEYSDQVTDGGCGEKIITRSWLFTDNSGNTATGCTQEFKTLAVTLADIVAPVSPIELGCGADVSMPAIVEYFTPTVGADVAITYGYPTANGTAINGAICNLAASKVDLEIPVCDQSCSNSFKVIRDWTILDWCTGEATSFTQIIKAVDNEAPTIQAQDMTVSTSPWVCEANFYLQAPSILHDDCTSFVEYSVSGPAGVTITYDAQLGLYYASNLPKGVHTFVYTASDCCENTAQDPIIVTVVDQTAPVAVAKQNIVISLTQSANGDGSAKLYAPSVDNGSHDGCTDVKLEIRRDNDECNVNGNDTYNNDGHTFDSNSDTDDGKWVKFCCEDITNAEVDIDGDGILDPGYVKVWMRVWDDGDMNGTFGSSGDNFNETWAFVKVEDKLNPIIQCPADITIACDDDADDFGLTGTATGSFTCDGAAVVYNDIINNVNTCGVGNIVRRWSIEGNPQVFCDQQITKSSGALFNGNITWPADFTTDCTDTDGNDIVPTWSSPGCSLIGYNLESDTFQFEDGACFKIINEWTVLDWCQYDPNSTSPVGTWSHIQIIKVLDDEAPVLTCTNQMFAVDDNTDADNDGNKCEVKSLMLTNTANDNGDCASQWLKWTVLVDVWGDGTYDYEYSSNLPTFDSNFNDSNGNGIADIYLAPTSSGEEVKITLPEDIQGSMSNHKIKWSVSDGCQNVTSCENTFMVVDKKAPTPYMIDISTAVMETACTVDLWAIDFNLGSFDNCTKQEDLRYTFSSTPPQNDNSYIEAQMSSSKTFGVEDVMNSPVLVTVYVWDEKGNSDFASVELTIIDNNGCVDPVDPTDGADACSCSPTEYTGWAVGTCNSDYDTEGAVGVIYDIRNTTTAPNGSDWGASITSIHPSNWTIDQIGQVFGIALDNKENVYLGASDVYDTQFNSDPYGPGQIFKASADDDFLAVPFVELPNTGGALNGIGNIAYCIDNNMLYASNLEDGKIYRINTEGTIMESYDPWTADNGNNGIVTASEQVWGIGLNKEDGSKKLYFAKVAGATREMYSVTLNENGSFPSVGSESLEFANIMGTGLRITDIAFNNAGNQMVFAERGTEFLTGAHTSKTLRYDLDGGNWNMELQYFVGGYVTDEFPSISSVPGENTAGGVDFGATTVGSSIEGCDELVWTSMNYFEDGNGGLFYGMQGIDADGNNSSEDANNPNYDTDIIIDYDEDYASFVQKGDLGDVEIFRCSGSDNSKPMIAGNVLTTSGSEISNVSVRLMSVLPEYPKSQLTDGGFVFENLTKNVNYQLSASNDIDYTNGVSTLDLVKIQRHILGLETLVSPYKLIAADIDADDKIKSSDLLQLRKLILGVITDLPTNESWRFVNGAQDLNTSFDLANVDYSIEIENLQSDMMDNNMIAIKVGDVTDNAAYSFDQTIKTEVRSNKTLGLSITNQLLSKNEATMIEVNASNTESVSGLQFAINIDGLDNIKLIDGALDITEANYTIEGSEIKFSWSTAQAMTIESGDILFSIEGKSTKETSTKDAISLNEKSSLSSEAYSADLEIMNLVIESRDVVSNAVFEVSQNEPNPFGDVTTIAYNLTEKGKVSISISDATGKVIFTKSTDAQKGHGQFTIEESDLNQSGVYYYTVTSGDYSKTNKMILIK